MSSIVETFGPTAATIGGGFFVGILIGYALKKVIKIVAIIVGLFLTGLAYLQYHHIANINWNKLQQISEGIITTLSNAIITQIPGVGYTSDQAASASSLALTSVGIPFTGRMSAGFTIEFMKGWYSVICWILSDFLTIVFYNLSAVVALEYVWYYRIILRKFLTEEVDDIKVV
jgi:uncharacterized membrane protein (Fun14 family)